LLKPLTSLSLVFKLESYEGALFIAVSVLEVYNVFFSFYVFMWQPTGQGTKLNCIKHRLNLLHTIFLPE
jgi:hypothetical protein